MFEDDDDSVDLPAGHMLDAEEVENTLAPVPTVGGRSRALATQYKLDQLEKQRDIQAAKRKQKMGGALLVSSKNETGVGGGGLRMAAFDDDDDDDNNNSDNDAPSMQIRNINDRGSNVTMLGVGRRNADIGNAAKKLQMLGLSDEIDHSEKIPAAGPASASPPQTQDAAGTGDADEEEEGVALPLDVSDVKGFVMMTIPKSQSAPVQCYIKRVRSGLQKLWPYYVLYSQDPDKFLLAGRRRKKNKQSTYLISIDEKELKRKSESYIGKCKSNFVGTEFTMWDSGSNPGKKEAGDVRVELGVVQYDRNVLGTNGPRKMQVMLPPTAATGVRDKLQPTKVEDTMSCVLAKGSENNYVKLVNKTPRWNESLGAFCLNFQV